MSDSTDSMMKLCAVLLSLLGLSLLPEALLGTHLQTCECHQIREMVNTTVDKAVASLEDRLSQVNSSVSRTEAGLMNKLSQVNSSVSQAVAGVEQNMELLISSINVTNNEALEKLENRLTATVQALIQPIQDQLNYHLPPPNSQKHPATSCKDLHEKNTCLPSGYYWVGESGSAVRVYCSMEGTCGSETGGWMRVAHLDMRNTSHTCPSGLTLITSPKRLCDIQFSSSRKCVSNTVSVEGIQYSRVCGRIIGYQNRDPWAFYNYYQYNRGIDGDYVDGVSLTHSQSPRKHIWTFAGARSERSNWSSRSVQCPCMNTRSRIPSYVGNNYF